MMAMHALRFENTVVVDVLDDGTYLFAAPGLGIATGAEIIATMMHVYYRDMNPSTPLTMEADFQRYVPTVDDVLRFRPDARRVIESGANRGD